MLSAHPPYQQDDDYPKADKVLRFLHNKSIQTLIKTVSDTGILNVDSDTSEPSLVDEQFKNSIAGQIVGSFNELDQKIKQLNLDISKNLRQKEATYNDLANELKGVESQIKKGSTPELEDQKGTILKKMNQLEPYVQLNQKNIEYNAIAKLSQRYYAPKEPVILIANGQPKPSASFETDYAFVTNGNLESIHKNVSKQFPKDRSWYAPSTIVQPKQYNAQWLLLEWHVEYLPVDDPSIDAQGFDSRFVFDNFDIRPDTPDFVPLKKQTLKLDENTRNYFGTTFITSGGADGLKDKFEKFLEHASSDQQKAFQPLLDLLNNQDIWTQTLGGFNESLLMKKQTMQLDIDDPIAFYDYKSLIENISIWVGDHRKSAPAPRNYFNPIRGGVMMIHQLRLVDTFGLAHDIYNNRRKR
jgi:hypothetical protein